MANKKLKTAARSRLKRLVSRTRGTTESYYAVRIGDPRRHLPYFMLQGGARTPALFATRTEAAKVRPNEASNRVVKVWLRDEYP
jgi:hypothetical protein